MSVGGGELNGAPEVRREQMIRAALEVIQERGFPDTRIADVAQRAGVSPALVIYYFGTKDSLLTEAIRYSEDAFYDLGARRMAAADNAKARLEEIVALNCLPTDEDEVGDSWTLWLDLWAQAARNPAVARVREEFDEHWRETIRAIVREGQASGEFGADRRGRLRRRVLSSAGRPRHPDRASRTRSWTPARLRAEHAGRRHPAGFRMVALGTLSETPARIEADTPQGGCPAPRQVLSPQDCFTASPRRAISRW